DRKGRQDGSVEPAPCRPQTGPLRRDRDEDHVEGRKQRERGDLLVGSPPFTPDDRSGREGRRQQDIETPANALLGQGRWRGQAHEKETEARLEDRHDEEVLSPFLEIFEEQVDNRPYRHRE